MALNMKYKYLLWEALFSLCMIISTAIFILWMHNLLITCIALMGIGWFLVKFILGVRLVMDMISGPCEAKTIFAGILNTERLDIFYLIHYQKIYFDDKEIKKNYMLFSDIFDVYQNELNPGDRIKIVYYKHSRIIHQLIKTNDI